MERDARQNAELVALGIRPLRFFSSEMKKKNAEAILGVIERELQGSDGNA